MVHISKIQRGFAMFIDREVAGAFDGWQRAVVAGCGGLVAANFPNLVKVYGCHPFVAAIGVWDPETAEINIDALYNAFVPKLGADKIPISIPKIGTIKMGREEIDTLMRYIREA